MVFRVASGYSDARPLRLYCPAAERVGTRPERRVEVGLERLGGASRGLARYRVGGSPVSVAKSVHAHGPRPSG